MFYCEYCGKSFKAHNNLGNHITRKHLPKSEQLYKTFSGVELDVTNSYVDKYLLEHCVCEICGRAVSDVTQ